jgi:hypothetical protein
MANYYNPRQIFNESQEEYTNKIIILQFKHIGESLLSHHYMIDTYSFQVDPQSEPKKHESLRTLAQKVLELWGSLTECAEEFYFISEEA